MCVGQTLRGHEHVVEAVAMGSLHFSALVELQGGVTAPGGEGGSTIVEKVLSISVCIDVYLGVCLAMGATHSVDLCGRSCG